MKGHRAEIGAPSLEEVSRFFKEYEQHWLKEKAEWARSAERFNIFYAIRRQYSEATHSTFLAFLLNPSERHDQGALFLERFLHGVVKLANPPNIAALEKTRVDIEVGIGSLGRMDIVLYIPDRRIVAIENKICADERPNQIGDYQEWLKERQVASQENVLVFLTPERRPPTTGSSSIRIVKASYRQISAWLSSCLPYLKASGNNRLSMAIHEYCELAEQITGELGEKDNS